MRHRIIFCFLLALSSGAYFNTLQAGFTYDDFFAVVSTFSGYLCVIPQLLYSRIGWLAGAILIWGIGQQT